MIDIVDKIDCCGCSACVQIWPQNCIAMEEDDEGFLYPKVYVTDCVDCGLCEKVCPVINRFSSSHVQGSFACFTNDENVRSTSSSGGILHEISKFVFAKGGVMYGACFDEKWEVYHGCADNIVDAVKFRGSKYVQSKIGNVYRDIRSILKKGQKVLFVGTPCQVSGLNHFLQKKYDNLIAIDIVCHSVPSPKVWRYYLNEISNHNPITNVIFRSKKNGWKNYSIKIDSNNKILVHEGKEQNLYMRGFLADLYTRPSCSACPARNFTSGSDLTIGDFWGCEKYYPTLDFDKGSSIVLVNTDKGNKLFKNIKNIFVVQIPYEQVEPFGLHRPLTSSSKPHYNRKYFFAKMSVAKSIRFLIFRCVIVLEVKRTVKHILNRYLKKHEK